MDMLSQEEIDALLGGSNTEEEFSSSMSEADNSTNNLLTDEQKDVLGEIGNISMGTAATTLFTLLNQKVTITTPKVRVVRWRDLSKEYVKPCVGIKVEYSEGIYGANVLVLQENDVKIITDLMMGGDGNNTEGELSDLHLSAIAEAMNQMIGSSSTSLSGMINTKIDIMPPQAFRMTFDDDAFLEEIGFEDDCIVCISFKMEIGSLIDSEIMQLYSIDFAKSLVAGMLGESETAAAETTPAAPVAEPTPVPAPTPTPVQQQPVYQQPMYQQPMYQQPVYQQPMYQPQEPVQQPVYQQPAPVQQPTVNVQPAQFTNFDYNSLAQEKKNIDIIKDVPLEVTVELGRTHKLIKEILEFAPGTIIELDTIAGEPIDILVNGKFVAKGEVVVLEENFGVRVTDIVSAENRI